MKNQNYIISIPEPCQEDWNSMIPDPNGKFCKSCNKSVIDFTNKTDIEIHEIMMEHKDKKVCGHLKTSQVNRPLALIIPYHHLPQNLSPTRAFAMALFIVFGAFLFSCTNHQNQKIDEIIVSEPESSKEMVLGGMDLSPSTEQQDTVEKIETQTTTISCSSVSVELSYVDGGVEYTESPMIDSLSEVMVESFNISSICTVSGGMAYTPVTLDEESYRSDNEMDSTLINEKSLNTKDDLKLMAFPNPSTGNINISYEFTKRGNVQLDVYDIKGVLVKTLVSQQNQYEGKYIIPTDLSDLVNGIYICRLNINGIENTTKLIIAK